MVGTRLPPPPCPCPCTPPLPPPRRPVMRVNNSRPNTDWKVQLGAFQKERTSEDRKARIGGGMLRSYCLDILPVDFLTEDGDRDDVVVMDDDDACIDVEEFEALALALALALFTTRSTQPCSLGDRFIRCHVLAIAASFSKYTLRGEMTNDKAFTIKSMPLLIINEIDSFTLR